ncbi:MAG TPA: hypothetical protein DCL08_00965 [Anaerolineaceae bacterium]|nr:hypothetical protein [Anaerolineaceae bacterium]
MGSGPLYDCPAGFSGRIHISSDAAFILHNRQRSLSFSQTSSLFRLYHHGESPVNDLSDHLGITMAAVSQLLFPLEEAGLIQRSEDPKDHRAKQISSTEKAKLRVHERISDRHAWLDDLAALLTNQEKEEILPGLLFLINRLANYKEALALTKTRSLKPPRQPMSSKGTTILSLNKKQKSRAE